MFKKLLSSYTGTDYIIGAYVFNAFMLLALVGLFFVVIELIGQKDQKEKKKCESAF